MKDASTPGDRAWPWRLGKLTLRWKMVGVVASSMVAVLATVAGVFAAQVAGAALTADQLGAVAGRALAAATVVLVGVAAIAFWLAHRLTSRLDRLTAAAAGMASGDLRQEVSASGEDEIGALTGSFRSMAVGFHGMVSGLGVAARRLRSEGEEIVGTVSRQASMSAQMSAAITETSATVTEIAQTSQAATEHADRVIAVAQRSEELSVQGRGKVEQVVSSMVGLNDQVETTAAVMKQLSQHAQQIGDVVATVKELAEQSNLLALNAAIEASRAGEHGRGFSVVALEMRNLAEQSKAAAGRVRTMLGEVLRCTEEAVQASAQGQDLARVSIQLAMSAGEAIEGLAEVIRESSLAAKQIAANTRQQTIGVQQIVTAIEEVSSAMSETVVGARQMERGTSSLSELASSLLESVQRYQV
jgi:methyl-accepting chemotaxis protein